MTLKLLMGEFRVAKYSEDNYGVYVCNKLEGTHSSIGFLKKEDLWKIRGELSRALGDEECDNPADEKQTLGVASVVET